MRRRFLCLGFASAALLLPAAGAQGATLPSGFQESTSFSGLTNPMAVEFSSDGRVFVAEKSGLIKVFDNLGDTTPTTFADLRTNVHNFWDRGLLGLALAPTFPADPHVYVLYAHDAAIGGQAPRWGTVGATSDGCPTPPGPTGDGCVISGRLSRLTASGNQMTGSEQVLIEDWCQQYPSHSVGDLAFGPDGALYASAGDGASFNFTDYGQDGSPINPCGDPPGGVGATLTPPSAEGGALRSQDVRTGGVTGGGGPPVTHRLRPNQDITSQWTVDGTATAWDAIDDDVTQPTEPAVESYLYSGTVNSTTEVGLTTAALNGSTPTAARAWHYMNVSAGESVRVDVLWGGQVRATQTISGGLEGNGYEWRSIDFVPPDQAAVDDLRLRFTVTVGSAMAGNIFAAYADVTAQGSSAPSTDPHGLDGTVIRIDPATGAGLPGNPMASSADANARRIVGYGLRNPFRFAIRPGTEEVWLGDVGWNTWEEVNRLADPTDATADNFGWPCYEGGGRQDGYDSANLNLCESLYTAPNVVAPHFNWNHSAKVVSTETCPTGSSSAAGVAFYTGGPYPASYDNAMFFADYSRDCIWAMFPGSNGLPNPANVITLAAGAANPVGLTIGPNGDLFYPDFDGGTVRRISFSAGNQPPNAVASANPTTGAAPLSVQFSASGSSDPDGGTLSYAWDLDNDGALDDSTAVNPTRSYAAGNHVVTLRVTDPGGLSDTDQVTITSGNTPPAATISAPASSTTWQVGSTVGFSGSASDAQQGSIPASGFRWDLIMDHCPSNCHTHAVQSFTGVSSGSFVAPDHEYPSNLLLRLTVTDAGGLTSVQEVRIAPRTYALTFRTTNPSGLLLTFNGVSSTSQFSRTVIRGSRNSISAPSPQTRSGRTYAFRSWSDGGARTHDITATANRTYTADYRRVSGSATFAACAKRKGKGKKGKRKRCRAARR